MKTLRMKRSTVIKAMQEVSGDWQNAVMSVILIPAVYRRWQALNPGFSITKHSGMEPTPVNMEKFKGKYSKLAGYTLDYNGKLYWNDVRDEYYSHSASTTWDGIRRNTIHYFVYFLYQQALSEPGELPGIVEESFKRAHIEFVDDKAPWKETLCVLSQNS